MKKIRTGLLFFVLSFSMLFNPVASSALSDYYRVSGASRIDTAIEISKAGWENSNAAILARADNPADALAAASLSGKLEAPILLTYTHSLPENVVEELERLQVSKVFILGGTSAISKEIANELGSLDYFVERISGKDRFETASKINVTAKTNANTKAIVVNGYTVADAISASSTSAVKGIPIYLTAPNHLPVELPKNITEVTIYGGEKVVGTSIVDQLEDKGIKVNRVSGLNRYETNIKSLNRDLSENVIIVRGTSVSSTREDYPDAVTASGLAKVLNANIILTHPTKTVPEVEEHFKYNRYLNIFVIGGENAVSSDAVGNNTAFVDTDLRQSIPEEVVDSVIHPSLPILFYTNNIDHSVWSLNFETGELNSIEFAEKPESLYYANDKLYVSLLKGNHSDQWWTEDQQGTVAIINGDSFKVDKKLDITLDPFDIVVDSSGILYVASGSGQHTEIRSYDTISGIELSASDIYEQTLIELSPDENRIYAIDTTTSPRDITVYELENGEIIDYWDSPYHGDFDLGDYPYSTKVKLSPDGKYVFNNKGNVFYGTTLEHYTKLQYEYNDILFHDAYDEFSIGMGGIMLNYDYTNFNLLGALSSYGDIQTLHQNKDYVVVMSKLTMEDSTIPAFGVEILEKNTTTLQSVKDKEPLVKKDVQFKEVN
jgi:putative cell wall-binding protein